MEHSAANTFLNDSQWVGKAQDHLHQHLQILASMVLHPHIMVRQSLQKMCENICAQSWKMLENARPVQLEMLAQLSVDQECPALRDQSCKTLQKLLKKVRDENDDEFPAWLVQLAHGKIFEVSQAISHPDYTENRFHDDTSLERYLATLHGFLVLLKFIEESRYVS